MKKFLVTILALVYLATSTGAVVHTHYCMGKIYSVDLVKKQGCSKCGMQENEGCCKDELKVVKIKDNHKLITNEINFTPSFALINYNYFTLTPVTNVTSSATYNSPTASSGASLCVLNCVFRL